MFQWKSYRVNSLWIKAAGGGIFSWWGGGGRGGEKYRKIEITVWREDSPTFQDENLLLYLNNRDTISYAYRF